MGIKNLITLLSFLFVLFSCEKEEFEPEINQRTTFMYFPWSEDLIEMAVGFLGKRKIMFFTHHQTFGFVGQDVVISISADTDNRFGA